jgi:hypothetical protein
MTSVFSNPCAPVVNRRWNWWKSKSNSTFVSIFIGIGIRCVGGRREEFKLVCPVFVQYVVRRWIEVVETPEPVDKLA